MPEICKLRVSEGRTTESSGFSTDSQFLRPQYPRLGTVTQYFIQNFNTRNRYEKAASVLAGSRFKLWEVLLFAVISDRVYRDLWGGTGRGYGVGTKRRALRESTIRLFEL